MAGLGSKSGHLEISWRGFDRMEFCNAAGTLLRAAEMAH